MFFWHIDILHSWHLGPLQRLIATVIWFILSSNVYGIYAGLYHADDVLHLKLLRLRSELWLYYRVKSREPGWSKRASQIWNLTVKMLGSKGNPNLRAKANESLHLVEFCVQLLETHAASLAQPKQKFLLESARAAVQVSDIFRTSPRIMSRDTQELLMGAYLRHCVFFQRSGGNIVIKHHLMLHLIQRCIILGNPKYYSCYRDESMNGALVKVARSCHRMTFMVSVHMKWNFMSKLGLTTHMF